MLAFQYFSFQSFEEGIVKYVFIFFGRIRININEYKQWQGIFYLLLTSKQEILKKYGSPQVGLEPTTNRLTADRSTTELLRNNVESSISYTFKDSFSLNRPRMQERLKNPKIFLELWELCVHLTLYSTEKR